MAAYAGGGTGSGDTHISQIMSKGKKTMAAPKKTGMAAKVGKAASPPAVHAKKTAAKKAAIAAGQPVAGKKTPRQTRANMTTARRIRNDPSAGGDGGY